MLKKVMLSLPLSLVDLQVESDELTSPRYIGPPFRCAKRVSRQSQACECERKKSLEDENDIPVSHFSVKLREQILT